MAGPWDTPPTPEETAAASQGSSVWDTPPTPDEVAAAQPAAPEPPGRLESFGIGVGRGAWAIPGMLGMDRAKATAIGRWLDGKLGFTPETTVADAERYEREREAAAEEAHPIVTGIGAGVGAAPSMLVMPQAPVASGAGLAARSAAGALTAGAQSAAVEAGLTADLPVGERLARVGAAGAIGAGMGAIAPGAPAGGLPGSQARAAARDVAEATSRARAASGASADAAGGAAGAQNVTELVVRPAKRGRVSRLLREPDPIPEAQYLRERGVGLTKGLDDPRSGFAQVEIASQSLEGVGPRIRAQRQQALSESMDLAFNVARPPGSKPLRLTGDVNDKFAALDGAWDAAYSTVKRSAGDVFPVIRDGKGGAPLLTMGRQPGAIEAALSNPDLMASDGAKALVYGFVKNQFTKLPKGRDAGGAVPAADLLNIRSAVRTKSREMLRQQKYEEHGLLRAAEEQITRALDSQLEPEIAGALRTLDGNYRTFKAVEEMVIRAGDMDIKPSQLSSAIRSVESNRNAYARGSPGQASSGEADDFVYHVTPSENLDPITSQGLRPDAPKIAEGGPHGGTRAVFLGEADALPVYRDLYGEDAAVLRTRRDGLNLEPDELSEGTAWMSRAGVPPDRLEVMRPDGSWEPLVASGNSELRQLSKAIRTVFDESAAPPTGARLLSVAPKWARESIVGPTIYLRNSAQVAAQGGAAGAKAGARAGSSASTRLSEALKADPAAFGQYAPRLLAAEAQRGPEGLAAAHYVLSVQDPAYAALMRRVQVAPSQAAAEGEE